MKLLEIIQAQSDEDIKQYCNNKEYVVTICYEFGKPFCDKVCDYAKKRMEDINKN